MVFHGKPVKIQPRIHSHAMKAAGAIVSRARRSPRPKRTVIQPASAGASAMNAQKRKVAVAASTAGIAP